MKHLKHLVLIVVSMCFVASSAIVSNAAQPGGIQGTGQNLSVAPGTSAPKILMQPLIVNMSGSNVLCNNLFHRIESIQLVNNELQTILLHAGDLEISVPGVHDLSYYPLDHTYKNNVERCCSPQKTFSVQEQQAAGCANSDTVTQCMEKLIRHCISKVENKDQIKTKLQKTQEKSNNISIKTKQLSEEIKNLLSIMP